MKKYLAAIALGMVLGMGLSAAYRMFFPPRPTSRGLESAENNARQAKGMPAIDPALVKRELLQRHENYVRDGRRHQRVLLEEIICVYMSVDAAGCLGVLRSLNALTLVSDNALGAAGVDLSDFDGVLRIASAADGQTGDALIRMAFANLIDTDPAAALRRLGDLPRHLREQLANRLAVDWARRDGPAACQAFLHYNGLMQRYNQLQTVFTAWGAIDPDAAFAYLQSLDSAGADIQGVTDRFLTDLASTNPTAADRLLPLRFQQWVNGVFEILTKEHPQMALQSAMKVSGLIPQYSAIRTIANTALENNPQLALDAAKKLPNSADSLSLIRKAAAKLAGDADQAYALAEAQADPYQRTAMVGGLAEGIYQKKGVSGLTEVVQKGIATNDPDWLESAASLILTAPAPSPGNASPTSWKDMPADVLSALTQYAEAHWPADKTTSLRAKIR
jgi:hypothetical protein